ncbi:helix-turn-helix transcriptional regulator [Brevundimonas sp. CEF1]|uniref:helix-turn-helix transcriptional regulator n=1 Tax=Brevundimonas sp. CEF1 TaxID=3442642 RepID=UPI003F50F3C6
MAKPPAPPPPCFIRLPEVARRTGVCGRQIYRWIGAGTFPKQIRVSYKVSVWIEAEVEEWLRLCLNARAPRCQRYRSQTRPPAW